MLNNLLFILGIIALSNGNISLDDNIKDNTIESDSTNIYGKSRGIKSNNKIKLKGRPRPKKNNSIVNEYEAELENDDIDNIEELLGDDISFNLNDINKGLKMLELSDEDLDRGMEIITRTKKYMNRDEKKFLLKLESMLDLVRGIKKLSSVEDINDIDESDFFRTMDEEDKKNMMIKEILEVFPDKKRDSIEKAIDMKKKIELFAELFLPDDIGEPGGSGFSLSSLANFSNLGSLGNLKLLGNLLRGDSYSKNSNDSYRKYEDYEESKEAINEYEEADEIIDCGEYESYEESYDMEDNEDSDDDYIKIY